MPRPLDLPGVRARYEMARLAAQAMDETEGDGVLDRARVRAVVRAWGDIAPLHDALRRATLYIAALETHTAAPTPDSAVALAEARERWRKFEVTP